MNNLPPDPESMNDDRASWAGHALDAFMQKTGTDEETALRDLLTNLMHWADRKDMDFSHELDVARRHYQEETFDAVSQNSVPRD